MEKALKDFFSRNEIKNNYKIFSLVDKLKSTAEGRKLMDKYMNTNIVKIATSKYSSIKFKASLGETSYLCVNDKMRVSVLPIPAFHCTLCTCNT